VLVEVARVEEVGSLGKVSLSEVVLVLLAVKTGAVKEGFSVVLLRWVPLR